MSSTHVMSNIELRYGSMYPGTTEIETVRSDLRALAERKAEIVQQLSQPEIPERRKLADERLQTGQDMTVVYGFLCKCYEHAGRAGGAAEYLAAADYKRAVDYAEKIYPLPRIVEQNRHEVNAWVDDTTAKTIEVLRRQTAEFTLAEHTDDVELQAKNEKKAQVNSFLVDLLTKHDETKDPKRSELARIIRGYMTDFVHQSELGIPGTNILNGHNEVAREIWAGRPQAFQAAKAPSLAHTVASFRKLQHLADGGGSLGWAATGAIIMASLKTFKAEYPTLQPEGKALASVYNDHLKIIALARDSAWQPSVGKS